MRLKIIIAAWVLFSTSLFAQKTERICGEYIYHAPENVSLEQAKQTALERAKIEALAEKFGTTVSQQNSTVVENKNGASDVRFLSLGGSEVKGEWIETTKEPQYTVSYEQGMLVVKVSVCGKAREIVGAGIDFTAKVLRNGTDVKFESDNFRDGDAIYLGFRSPTDGYLAVYLVDESQTVYCLLPYLHSPSGNARIKSGKDYVFFSEKNADRAETAIVDEYVLTTDKQAEQNFLYVIFSPHEFTKANDNLRELSYEEFQRWLAKNRTRDKDMKVEVKGLTVIK
ncbi:hypothetical protein AGMMS50262_00040 [Bacteroidia bacterium]|nr:hypothetical protein AGMMS50262_00040 [Bacteroidia bacterium]